MFIFKTKRKLLNEQAKVKNRDKLIEDFENKMQQLKEENKLLRFEKEELQDILKEIYKLAISNKYDNDKVFYRKIKELAETAIKN